ncbi:hypothetical protein [Streptomyces sp. CAU 1734]|uniref:hypothetical protein n=1 Tax=Streptomyces sp. CAU 1734 TaxID=3140360 RepID=UPI0032609396
MSRVGAGVVAGLVLAVGAAGCTGGDGARGEVSRSREADRVPVSTPPAPAPAPYSGPLYVADASGGEVRAGDTEAELTARATGAAGRALECEGNIHSGGPAEPWSEGDGGATAAEGLKAFFAAGQPEVPHSGYRVERAERDRVLYSLDAAGRTKVAVIVAKDRPRRPGWGPETSAWCDPAELPAAFTDGRPYEIWTDRDGERVPFTKLNSQDGPEHCAWQKARFLALGAEPDRRMYARDPDGVLPPGMLRSRYDGDAALPAGAADTGYRLERWELWLAGDRETAYIRTPRGVEAWPSVADGMACK